MRLPTFTRLFLSRTRVVLYKKQIAATHYWITAIILVIIIYFTSSNLITTVYQVFTNTRER